MKTAIGYRVGWLIDGTGTPAVANRVVVVDAGRIRRIVDGGRPLPAELKIVDWSEYTMFPALVDSHVHLVMSGSMEADIRRRQLHNSYTDRRRAIRDHLASHLRCGILAVRDGGDHNGDTLRYKWDPANHPQPMVTIAASGRARHARGRYGKLIGIDVGSGMSLTRSAFDSATRRDHLKLVNSGLNSLTQFGVEYPPQFSKDELADAIATARKHGQLTMVHANGFLPVKLAVEAGCASIEHGFFMGRENMRRMADRGVVWVPTAVTMKAYGDYLKKQGHRSDPSFADVSRKNLEHQLAQIRAAREMGVTLAVGTDAGSPGVHHGMAVKEELQLFIAAGYNVENAIRCASRNGALLMGLADRGEITPGMRADANAVKALPEKVPDALHHIVYRMVEGRVIDVDPTGSTLQ
jgi:imidazolonepropionase-like amidohydrolase